MSINKLILSSAVALALTGCGGGDINIAPANSTSIGDTVTNVLNLAHFDTKKLIQSYEKQLINSKLPKEQTLLYLNELRSIFSQLTYLDMDVPYSETEYNPQTSWLSDASGVASS